ncbi:hypothetical protein CMI48_02535 [Candidatus Pacearchaeota archaeon]|nr:hypothetical protein [Candidatus Pacearchaeota archaeon]
MAKIRILREGNLTGVYELPERGGTTVSRSSGAEITMPQREVSVPHCIIIPRNGTYKVVDLASTNGTYVRNEKITEARDLNNGDAIQLGRSDTLLIFLEE